MNPARIKMNAVEREIATYTFSKIDRLVRRDWGIFPETLRRWEKEGWDGSYDRFLYDESPYADDLINLVGIDLPLDPPFKEEITDKNEEYVFMSTKSGGIEKFPKDKKRWDEIMPAYHKNPVASPDDWNTKIKPRLDPDSPGRWVNFNTNMDRVSDIVKKGDKLYAGSAIGGYMYLRAMMGPEGVLMAFYDYPEMIHDMMQTWAALVKTCLLRVQKRVPFFKFLIGEDISYKNGPLISPDMMKEFLLPYYNDLIETLKKGQFQAMHVEVDTDGNVKQVLPLYMSAGFNVFRPFEVAAGNDVVEYAKKYSKLVISGGIDKRILAKSKEAIKQEVERIIPFMVKRGGYIPTCDHTVPSDVPYENYLYYRKLITSIDSR